MIAGKNVSQSYTDDIPFVPQAVRTHISVAHYRKAAEMMKDRILKDKKWRANTALDRVDTDAFIQNAVREFHFEKTTSLLHCLVSSSMRLFESLVVAGTSNLDLTVHREFIRRFKEILETGFREHNPEIEVSQLYLNRSLQIRTLNQMIWEAKEVMEKHGIHPAT